MFRIIVFIAHIPYVRVERHPLEYSPSLLRYTVRPVTRQSRPLELEEERKHSTLETGERLKYVGNGEKEDDICVARL
jgi:hypothetical protein